MPGSHPTVMLSMSAGVPALRQIAPEATTHALLSGIETIELVDPLLRESVDHHAGPISIHPRRTASGWIHTSQGQTDLAPDLVHLYVGTHLSAATIQFAVPHHHQDTTILIDLPTKGTEGTRRVVRTHANFVLPPNFP